MLTGSTYVQINFGNLTLINGIQLTVPASFAPILTIQLGYSWDGISFAMDSTQYFINGSSSYVVPLSNSLMIRYLRVYLIDVVQPNDLLTKTSGFSLNITGTTNSTNATIASTMIRILIDKKIIILFFRCLSKRIKYIITTDDTCGTSVTSWSDIFK